MPVVARNREKFTKTPYFGGSTSFKVIDIDISKKLVASAFLHICNHFHVRRANSGRKRLFRRGAPFSPSRSWEPLPPSGMKFFHEILETLSYHMVQT